MIVLVAGGSRFADGRMVRGVLDAIHEQVGVTALVFGDSTSLEWILRRWAEDRGVLTRGWMASWGESPVAASERNDRLLAESGAELVVSFPGGGDLTGKALDAGLAVFMVPG